MHGAIDYTHTHRQERNAGVFHLLAQSYRAAHVRMDADLDGDAEVGRRDTVARLQYHIAHQLRFVDQAGAVALVHRLDSFHDKRSKNQATTSAGNENESHGSQTKPGKTQSNTFQS